MVAISSAQSNSNQIDSGSFDDSHLMIGWASADITPDQPALLQGQFHARISEGVMDPITITALAIESRKNGKAVGKVIMISCDLVGIRDILRDGVRERLKKTLPEIESQQVFLNATHTHTAPYCSGDKVVKDLYGVELDAMVPADYLEFITGRIAEAAVSAWNGRIPGGISYGLGFAVIGHNRLAVDYSGTSVMYGSTSSPEFSHMEGYEDHSVQALYTWDTERNLTGVVINIHVPSQVSEQSFLVSADFWHNTRVELCKRMNKDIYILPQCGAAGDQSPHIMIGKKAEERMQGIMGLENGNPGVRQLIALRITDAVMSMLPYMKENIEWNLKLDHRAETVNLTRRLITIDDVNKALEESGKWEMQYEQMLKEIKDNPEITKKPRWYKDITIAYSRMMRGVTVQKRFELQKTEPVIPVEIHVIRIGDIVMASNPFELYLDYGIRIKGRSPAVQTFTIQLAGNGTYLPPFRSTVGGSYGAEAASTNIGPEGGRELVEKTLELINATWSEENK